MTFSMPRLCISVPSFLRLDNKIPTTVWTCVEDHASLVYVIVVYMPDDPNCSHSQAVTFSIHQTQVL